MFRHLQTQLFFILGIMIDIINLYILISVWMTTTFIHGYSCMKNQTLWWPFFQKCWELTLMKFSVHVQTECVCVCVCVCVSE